MTTKLFTSLDLLVKGIAGIEKTAGKLRDDIHKAGVSAAKLFHDKKITAQDMANCLTMIQKASPYHANAFSKWVGVFFPTLEFAKEGEAWFAKPDVDHKLMGKDFIALRDKPFWEVSPPAKAQPFDDVAALERLLGQAVKHYKTVQEGKAPEGSKPMPVDLYKKIQAVVAEHKAQEQAA